MNKICIEELALQTNSNEIGIFDGIQAQATKTDKLSNLNSTYEKVEAEITTKEDDIALSKSPTDFLNSTKGLSLHKSNRKQNKPIKLSTLYKPILRRFRAYMR